MTNRVAFAAALLALPMLVADTGVLLPTDRTDPDPSVFSLNEMRVDIRIDNGVARVQIREIFLNHTENVHEGTYQFALPENATISDFAVWDDVTRIPGVILERRRANEIYNIVSKPQTIDPGLLQMGERDASEAGRSPQFSVKIVPIPAFGTKRVEMEYQQPIVFDHFQSEFAVPLKSDTNIQTAGHLTITLDLASEHAIKDFAAVTKAYPLKITERSPKRVKAVFAGDNVELSEDFTFQFGLNPSSAGTVSVITEREDNEGFFGASALLPMEAARPAAGTPHTVVVLFDTSLSMQWEKLERSFQACEMLLHGLRATDSFNLLLFNSDVSSFAPAPKPATAANIEQALAFVKNSRIRGGTDLQKALKDGLAQLANARSDTYLVVISDGGSTEGTIHNGKLGAWYSGEWKKVPLARRPHTFVFGVGDDANVPLLEMLAGNGGVLELIRSTESLDFKLNAFIAKIGRQPVKQLGVVGGPSSNFTMVYPLEEVRFGGSVASWVGQYKKPLPKATFTVRGTQDEKPLVMTASAALPAQESDHPYLPRTWARARVDALLQKIERDGEDRATIDEIIRLSKKYKFVTPYTSFLAVPRARCCGHE
jgi:Ca-activated chloride channel family protein